MTMNQPAVPANSARRAFTNGVLTTIAGLLAFNVYTQSSRSGGVTGEAFAQGSVGVVGEAQPSDDAKGLVSAADQRKSMINELRELNARLERMESVMERGLNVKVTSMPAESRRAAQQEPAADAKD
ncbi:MAG TPA: hypothetical protein VD971_00350 [Phycisphaerales bacterium]|nr:hypothetical protein [Phycisphaerales bacterium]